MIISATAIRTPRTARACEMCKKPITGLTLKLFGAAFTGDKPYTIFVHPDCIKYDQKNSPAAAKVRAAMDGLHVPAYTQHDRDLRCPACGCFLSEVDRSTEAGYDFDLVCKNQKCGGRK